MGRRHLDWSNVLFKDEYRFGFRPDGRRKSVEAIREQREAQNPS